MSAPGRAASVHRAGAVGRALELVLVGLTRDEDELLGDLAEGSAEVASAQGARAAGRWWTRQVLVAIPRLVWHGLVHRPTAVLLGLAGFMLWAWVASAAYTASWFPVAEQVYDGGHPELPPVNQVIRDTALVGVWNLLAAVVAGAAIAAVAHRVRLVPVALAAGLMALVSTRHAFWIVYGPGTCTTLADGNYECSLELGAWSNDVVVPVLWQLPTMVVLLPLATVLGGLAVVAGPRSRSRRGRAGA